jgi:RNA polymerase sigma-70 factor (ECF subfamily)
VSDVVRRAQSGDQSAFKQLYGEHAGRVYALCLRLTGNAADAEERTQDVFVRAWEYLGSFRGESAFSSWLHRVAVNVVMMEQRTRARREQRVRPAGGDPRYEDAGERHPSNPGEQLDLERAIAALPPGARTVFVLHDVEGYSHDEIGRRCGIAEGTSKAQLFRARRLLREMLER